MDNLNNNAAVDLTEDNVSVSSASLPANTLMNTNNGPIASGPADVAHPIKESSDFTAAPTRLAGMNSHRGGSLDITTEINTLIPTENQSFETLDKQDERRSSTGGLVKVFSEQYNSSRNSIERHSTNHISSPDSLNLSWRDMASEGIRNRGTFTADDEQNARLKAYEELERQEKIAKQNPTPLIADFADLIGNTSVKLFDGKPIADLLPDNLKKAAIATNKKIAAVAEKTRALVEEVPDLIVNAIPDKVMSAEAKQLVFIDFSNTLRSFFHTNILSMPFVFNMAGLVGGLILITFVAITSEYATEAYFSAKNQLKDSSKVMMYGDVPRMTWGKWYPMLNFFYGVTHLIGFLAFAATNTKVLLSFLGIYSNATILGLVIPSLIALPLVFMKRASSQKPLAMASNFLVFASVIVMMASFPYNPSNANIALFPKTPGNFFVALGITVYAFTGIGSAVPVERTMVPKLYLILLRVSVATAYGALAVFGLSGYLSFGSGTCSVVTSSLRQGAPKALASTLLFIASIAIIPQQTFPFCELCDRRFLGIRHIPGYWERKPNFMRIFCLAGSAFIAYILPYYGLLLSISGAFGCGIIGIIVPAALDYVRRVRIALLEKRTLRFYEHIIVFGLGFYGCTVVVVGVCFGLYDLWRKIQTHTTGSC